MALAFCFVSFLYAEVIYVNVIPESVETLTRNTEFINSDPENLMNSLGRSGLEDEEDLYEETAGQLGIQAETVVSMRNIYFNLPVRYRWKGLTAEAKLPVILKREIRYDEVSKSASGLGDAIVKFSYRFKRKTLLNESMVHVKLPTGNQDKRVDDYLVPLGNGSLDFILQNTVHYRMDMFTLYNSVSFRINTGHERIVQINHTDAFQGTETVTYTVRNGHLFTMNSSVTYPVNLRAAAIAGLSLSVNGEGELERQHSFSGTKSGFTVTGLSAEQDFVFIDLLPAIVYTLYRTDMMICGRIPVLTIRNDANSEESRKAEIFFRLSRELF